MARPMDEASVPRTKVRPQRPARPPTIAPMDTETIERLLDRLQDAGMQFKASNGVHTFCGVPRGFSFAVEWTQDGEKCHVMLEYNANGAGTERKAAKMIDYVLDAWSKRKNQSEVTP